MTVFRPLVALLFGTAFVAGFGLAFAVVLPPAPPESPPVPAESKVLPIGPNLMLEKMTLLSGACDSTSAGTPEVVGQVPRTAPALVEFTGYVESSQSMLA